jgi:hypothetical protein
MFIVFSSPASKPGQKGGGCSAGKLPVVKRGRKPCGRCVDRWANIVVLGLKSPVDLCYNVCCDSVLSLVRTGR